MLEIHPEKVITIVRETLVDGNGNDFQLNYYYRYYDSGKITLLPLGKKAAAS